MKKLNVRVYSFLSVLLLIGIWLFLTLTGQVKPLFLPGPQQLYDVIVSSYRDVLINMGYTLVRQISGFLIGTFAGIVVGLLIASNRYIEAFMDPIIEILRPIPPLAITPLLILWLGIGAFPQMLLVVFGCFVIVIVSTVEAVRNVPRIYINAARTLGANSFAVYQTVVLPAIIPSLVGAIRVAAGASFGLVIAAEFMGAQEGIGYFMIIAVRYLRTDMILLSIIIISVLAWLTDRAIRVLEKRLTRWSERHS